MKTASEYISTLAGKGRYVFSLKEIVACLRKSEAAVRAALRRLENANEISSPARGMYQILPFEYRSHGSLPAEQFIPELMAAWKRPYYAALLSAAQFHGAAHQRPQVFQVMTDFQRLPIECGQVRVDFVYRKNCKKIPTETLKTPRGFVELSTPEATAFDLVGYEKRCGGLGNVATVLSELSDKLSSEKLGRIAMLSPVAWSQRLGYLLARIGNERAASALQKYLEKKRPVLAKLSSSASMKGHTLDPVWRLAINIEVEPDI